MNHGWEYKKLGEVCEPCSAKRVHQSDWTSDGVPFFRAREIVKLSETGSVDNDLFIREEHFEKLKKFGCPESGDIMLSAVGTLGAAYVVKKTDRFYYKDASVLCLKKLKDINSYFLKYLFQTKNLKNQIEIKAPGATVGTITISNVKNFKIPVPSIQEQETIVAELDKINEMIEASRALLGELDSLAQSLFYDTFGDPITNPKRWPIITFEESAIKLCDGPFGSNLKSEHYQREGIRVIRLQNIGAGYFDDRDKAFISEEHSLTLQKFKCNSGDIVIGTLGDPNVRACLIPEYLEESIHKADCLHYIPKDTINRHFAVAYINTPEFLTIASNGIHGSTRTRIPCGKIKKMPIPLPPLALQNQFASQIEAIERQKADIEATIAELQTLLDSRMDYWFNDN